MKIRTVYNLKYNDIVTTFYTNWKVTKGKNLKIPIEISHDTGDLNPNQLTDVINKCFYFMILVYFIIILTKLWFLEKNNGKR